MSGFLSVNRYNWNHIPSGADVPVNDHQIIATFNKEGYTGKISFADNGSIYLKNNTKDWRAI